MNLLYAFTVMKEVKTPDTNNGSNLNMLNKQTNKQSTSIPKKDEKDKNFKYLDTFLNNNKLDVYEKIRDNGEPFDELTKALRSDDVDKLQEILSKSNESYPEQAKVPYNIFEEYIENGNTSYINYSAAYGSIKCFKYLLLNHHKIDDETFKYSIYGGNIEIIKIVDQKTNSLNRLCNTRKNELISAIIMSIAKHRNDIFDWIMSNVFFQKVTDINAPIFKTILKFSAKNSNAHSLISIFGKGYNMSADFDDLITYASANGFYKIIQLICLLTKKKNPKLQIKNEKIQAYNMSKNVIIIIPSLFNENLSIIKLYSNYFLQNDIFQYTMEYSISREFKSIIKYLLENYPLKKYNFKSDFLLKCLLDALDIKNNDDIFYILFNNLKIIYSNLFDYPNFIDNVLIKTINKKKLK